jgi:uncharacterized protein YndB with AHSA1/START domain
MLKEPLCCSIDSFRVSTPTERDVWRKESTGTEMGMGGVFREVVGPEKLAATERFDDAWYAGEALDTTLFEARGGSRRSD